MSEQCGKVPCPNPPTKGAYCVPVSFVLGGSMPTWQRVKWGYAILCLEHGQEALDRGARYLQWRPKGERPMGPVASALRTKDVMSSEEHRIYSGARAELVWQGNPSPTYEEIMSEAIEAAEALGV